NYVFPNPINPFETFFPESRDVSLQDTPISELDFTAIKVGDVNASVNPVQEILTEERNLDSWAIFVQDVDFQSGEMLTATFQAGMSDLAGAQFSLQFDPE